MAPQGTPAVLEARHRLAIAGRVTADKRPVAGAEVTIEAYERRRQAGAVAHGGSEQRATRPDPTATGSDGCFRFLDLPPGTYTLAAALPALGARYGTAQVRVTVKSGRAAKPLKLAELALPPTAIEGTVTVEGTVKGEGTATGERPKPKPVAFADVRVAGGGPATRSDGEGRYRLPGIEPGKFRIRASAQGLRAGKRTATVRVGETRTVGFRLGST